MSPRKAIVPVGGGEKESCRTVATGRRPINICVLGSTGSIGSSTLDVVRSHTGFFRVIALAAGANAPKLFEQIKEFRPRYVSVKNEQALEDLKQLVSAAKAGGMPELSCGDEKIAALAALPEVDVVLAAIVGFAGLRSVISALQAGKMVALANKESLVAGGRLVEEALAGGGGTIVPVDSEHSAVFQALRGQEPENIKRLLLTASGGPFLLTPKEDFDKIKPEEALRHPKWKMGSKISIDSATMMNKALEVIEAHWLFGLEPEKIDVLVHPQSIVHSLIELIDGSQLAQLSVPDMKGPIAYALTYPDQRLPAVMNSLDLAGTGVLEFFPMDNDKFPAVNLARAALKEGGAASAVLNIANEVAVDCFLNRRLRFDQIVPFAAETLERHAGLDYGDFEELLAIDRKVRRECRARTEVMFG